MASKTMIRSIQFITTINLKKTLLDYSKKIHSPTMEGMQENLMGGGLMALEIQMGGRLRTSGVTLSISSMFQ